MSSPGSVCAACGVPYTASPAGRSFPGGRGVPRGRALMVLRSPRQTRSPFSSGHGCRGPAALSGGRTRLPRARRRSRSVTRSSPRGGSAALLRLGCLGNAWTTGRRKRSTPYADACLAGDDPCLYLSCPCAAAQAGGESHPFVGDPPPGPAAWRQGAAAAETHNRALCGCEVDVAALTEVARLAAAATRAGRTAAVGCHTLGGCRLGVGPLHAGEHIDILLDREHAGGPRAGASPSLFSQ